ncbi:MAG TPA: right-handed parallel beta-helix repeat-containing protein [Pirellulaceae bacterium]|nr:right-handed parallel beta-helix repeat-containing protein [Pirellulaceae bacterium]
MSTSFSDALIHVRRVFSPQKLRRAARRRVWQVSARRAFLETLESRCLLATFYAGNEDDYIITNDQGAAGLDNGDTVTFSPNPSAGSGHSVVPDLTFGTEAFTTIQGAVDAAAAGDTVRVAPGTYAESVNINKQLFVLGNQNGIDAQDGRVGAAESIVSNGSTSFQLSVDDIVLDGFTIQGAINPNLGFGVTLLAGTAGSEVRNNIIQDNIAGISLANDSATNQTIISGNLIRNNNQAGPASGTGIYTDQFSAGGALTNVLIDDNTFSGNTGPAVNLASSLAASQSNITISCNTMTANGNGVVLFNTVASTISENEITGSTGSQIFIGGGVDGLAISENFIENGTARGISINNIGFTANQNITINRNSIENNGTAGLGIATATYVGTLNAEFNWWGSATGPLHPRNPGGTGDEIVDPDDQVDFEPWLPNGVDTQPELCGFQASIADLSITKSDAPDPVVAGTTLTYTIVVTNNGPDTQTNAVVTDTFPAQLTNVTFTSVAAGGATDNDATGTGNINDTVTLPAGSTITYTVTGTVASSATGTISNTATITAPPNTFETDLTNNSATETTTLLVSADLSVTKSDSPDPVVAGENLTYTIVVTNNGPSDAQSVTLTDLIPAGTTFVSFTEPSGFTSTEPAVGGTGTVTSTTPTLAAGAVATFTLVVQANASLLDGSTISNTATVSTATADPTPGNNSVTATTTVSSSADLSVTKSDSPDTVVAGENLTYTIVVTNNGPSDAQNVVLTDAIPANTTFVSFTSPSGWSNTTPPPGGTGTVTSTTPTLAAGAVATFTLVVQANSDLLEGDVISNTVTVTSTTSDPNAANNTHTEDTNVVRPGLPVCDVSTLNSPGNENSATLEDDADFPGQGVLIVTGTSGKDVIIVEPNHHNHSEVRVRRNGRIIGTFDSDDFERIVVFGLEGNDKIIINAKLSQDAVLVGNEGNDMLFGARGNDSLDGGEGNDKLFGGAGNDVLCGGDGNDFLYGQAGDDVLDGGDGKDKLFGEAGNDLLIGGTGNDFLYGGTGDDRLFGLEGNDLLFGESGNDILVGGDGNDKLFGGTGRDLMIGGDGADKMFGQGDDDILVAGFTSHDNDEAALMAILAEWTSSRSYSTRVANLSGEELGGDNDPFFLNDASVFDDGANDLLWGQGGVDWFLIGSGDRIKDRTSNERVN